MVGYGVWGWESGSGGGILHLKEKEGGGRVVKSKGKWEVRKAGSLKFIDWFLRYI